MHMLSGNRFTKALIYDYPEAPPNELFLGRWFFLFQVIRKHESSLPRH